MSGRPKVAALVVSVVGLLGLLLWLGLGRGMVSGAKGVVPGAMPESSSPAPEDVRLEVPSPPSERESVPEDLPAAGDDEPAEVEPGSDQEDPLLKRARMRARMEALAAEEDWAGLYSGIPVEDLREYRSSLEQTVVELTSEYMQKQFELGHYELTNEIDVHVTGPEFNPFEICRIRFEPGQRAKRVVAPEAEFDDAYRLRARSVWLWEEIQRRR